MAVAVAVPVVPAAAAAVPVAVPVVPAAAAAAPVAVAAGAVVSVVAALALIAAAAAGYAAAGVGGSITAAGAAAGANPCYSDGDDGGPVSIPLLLLPLLLLLQIEDVGTKNGVPLEPVR